MVELREMKKAEASYSRFQQETVMDSGFEKDLDNIIDEHIKQGKTDSEILDYISGM